MRQKLIEKEKDPLCSNNQFLKERYHISFTLEKPTSGNHSIRKTSSAKKRNRNFSTDEKCGFSKDNWKSFCDQKRCRYGYVYVERKGNYICNTSF